MKDSVYRRNCTCKKKRCTCGAKWYFKIDIGIDPATGRRKQKEKGGFSTKAEAEEACATLIHELRNGTHVEESNILFKDFSRDWLKIYQKKHTVKISTIRIRQHEIDKLMPYFAHVKMKDITKKKYQEALNNLHDQGFADNTISGIHSTGRMIFKTAMEYDIIKTDPTQFARVPRTQKTVEELEQEKEVPKYLEKEELSLFLQAAKEKDLGGDYTVFMVLAYTGLRAGELCALKWRDIDFEAGTISITKTYYNPTNNILEYKLLTPKTKKSKRIVEVDKVVLDELEKHRAKQNKIRMKYRNTYHDEDFIFASIERHPGYPEVY